MSVKLYNFAPVLFVPLAVFSHIRWAFFPVPFLDWHMPIFSVVRKDVSLGFARYTCFQAKKLSPAKGEYWKNVPYGENNKNTSKQTNKQKKTCLWMLTALILSYVQNGRNNFKHCWDMKCMVGRIKQIPGRPCVMRVHVSNNVGRAVHTNLALLRYVLAITERKKWWELSLESSQIENELWLRNGLLLKVNRPNHHT